MSLRDAVFYASYQNSRARPIQNPYDVNSPNCYDQRGSGQQVSKLVTLTAAGAPVLVNLFEITGFVELKWVFGIFEDVSNVDDIDNVYLDVWDGITSKLLSPNAGLDCDGVTLGAALLKAGDAGTALEKLDADEIRIYESSKNDIVTPVTVNGKNGVTNYMRMGYRNIDTNLNCQIKWYAEWRSLCGSPGSVVVT